MTCVSAATTATAATVTNTTVSISTAIVADVAAVLEGVTHCSAHLGALLLGFFTYYKDAMVQ